MIPRAYKAFLRTDFYTFIERSFYELNATTDFLPNWHIEAIADELEKCRRGETNRLIINVPPRSLKSHCASVAFPAWLLGHNPSEKIIAVSYGQDLADKHALDSRTLMASQWYQRLFPTRLNCPRPAISNFRTTNNGFRLSVSVGGPLTGRGGDFIIIDDPLKPDEALSDIQRTVVNAWYDHTLLSRLNDKQKGCIIVIMQRLHEDDLVGHLVVASNRWKVLRLPAIAEEDETHEIASLFNNRKVIRRAGEALHPNREPLATLQEIRSTVGEYNFAAQYQQVPAPFGGGIVKEAWFRTYTSLEIPTRFEMIIQSWDTANKPTELSDFSVCTTWGTYQKRIYLLNVFRRRLDYPALKRAVRDQSCSYQPNVILIEDRASGTQLIQELTHEGMGSVQAYTPTMEKTMRLHTASSSIENGLVYLPENADWRAEYLHEITTFPKSKHDDQTDSTSQALDWIKQRYFQPTVQIFQVLL